MTRDQITTLVTSTTGQTDATSVSLCNDYVQRAYEMVWNAELWADTVDIDTTATITSGNNTFSLPSGFDRVISIQLLSGGVPVGLLEPTTSAFIQQTEPTALTTNGIPTKYEEFTSGSTKSVRIFPKANASYTFTIVAKKVCPTLSGSTNLLIRNVDNAVVSLATADMYTRMRQLGKAAEMAKKAGAFLDEARGIEKSQSNQPRAAKQLPDAANSLQAMADSVSALTGQYSPESMIVIKEFLRRNYQRVYDSNLWSESTVVIDKASVLGVLILPEFVDRVISIRGTSTLGQLSAVQPSIYFGINPWIFEQTGDPLAFSYLTSIALPSLPTAAERLTFTNAGSEALTIYVAGEVNANGDIARESVTVAGSGGTGTTVQSYLVPLTISKPYSTGAVVVSGFTSLTSYVSLPAEERERKYIRIQFQPTPTANVTCKVLCKRRILPLLFDNDTPLIRSISNVLIDLAASDMFMKLGLKDNSARCQAKADEELKTMVDLEQNQGAMSSTIVPEVEYAGAYGYDDDWIVAK